MVEGGGIYTIFDDYVTYIYCNSHRLVVGGPCELEVTLHISCRSIQRSYLNCAVSMNTKRFERSIVIIEQLPLYKQLNFIRLHAVTQRLPYLHLQQADKV
jgi:hypothetical protein